MSSPSQKHGSCGHIMAGFDSHSFCAHCREKGKGSDPCVSKNDCNSCNILSEDQRLQLSTPSYRIKKEKRDLKKSADTPKQDSASSSLIDPSSVTVVGVVDDQGILQSPGSSSGKKKKPNPPEKVKAHPSKESKTVTDKTSKSLATKTHRSSPDTRIDELDQKWSERFNRLEAFLLAKSLDREPTFATMKVSPALLPVQLSPQNLSSSLLMIQNCWLPTDHRNQLLLNNLQICLVIVRLFPSRPANRLEQRCLPTDIQMLLVPTLPYHNRYPADHHQHRQGETVYLRWTPTPTCLTKMGKLDLTLTEGYPSHSSEAGGLLKDQFVRPPKTQSKWYNFVPNPQKGDQETGKTVNTWSTDASKVNSSYSRIAKAAGIASTPPASRQISQDNLRRWEKSARKPPSFATKWLASIDVHIRITCSQNSKPSNQN